MSDHKHEVDEVTGINTTGHEWDGIKELDNPLPRWWLYIFYATIVWAAVYWVLMPAWPGLTSYTKGTRNHSDRDLVAQDLTALRSARADDFARLTKVSAEAVQNDDQLLNFARAAGQAAFGDNCATCHGSGAQGNKGGYPNLNDDVWLWGGTLADIEHTLKVGIRSTHEEARFSQMPAYGRDDLLTPAQVKDVSEYVVALGAGPAEKIAAGRGAAIFAEQCTSCHGVDGKGDRAQGAPNLTDGDWLKAGPEASANADWAAIRASIQTQMHTGSGGVMPNWDTRLDAATIRALAIYVHSLGGGEKTPEPVPVEQAAAQDAAPAPQ